MIVQQIYWRLALKRFPRIVLIVADSTSQWIATASALYLSHALASNSSTEEGALSHLLADYDFHIIPAPNPDGYVYTWESDRFWYKNRMPAGPDEACVGVDMNRWVALVVVTRYNSSLNSFSR